MTCFTAPFGPRVHVLDASAVLAAPTIGAPRVGLPARTEATIADDPIRVPRRRRARLNERGMLTSETLGPRRRGPPGAATPRPRIAMPAGRTGVSGGLRLQSAPTRRILHFRLVDGRSTVSEGRGERQVIGG